MTQRKYTRFMSIVTPALTAAEATTGKGLITEAVSRLMQHDYASTIETIIESYGINVQEQTDSHPPAEMAKAYVDWVYSNGPKPEWLTHAGL